jgi:hypothetical protein
MKKVLVLVLLMFLVSGLVFGLASLDAKKEGKSSGKSNSAKPTSIESSGDGETGDSGSGNAKPEKIKVETEEGKFHFRSKDGQTWEVKTKMQVKEQSGRYKVVLGDGSESEVNVFPEEVAGVVADVLGTENFSLELKEKKNKAVYSALNKRQVKLLGIFSAVMDEEVEIDPETGEIIGIDESWWAFLATGKSKVTICHVPRGDPEAAHTITVGAPATKAHIGHGDYLGECEGGTEPPGNQTNQTEENLTLEIISPENMTYNFTEILVDIASNGDNVWYYINNATSEVYNVSFSYNFTEGNHSVIAFANNSEGDLLEREVFFEVLLPLNITEPVNETNSTNQTS